MVNIGSGAQKAIDDIMLSRYACYLIAQNGDPKKEAIASINLVLQATVSGLRIQYLPAYTQTY